MSSFSFTLKKPNQYGPRNVTFQTFFQETFNKEMSKISGAPTLTLQEIRKSAKLLEKEKKLESKMLATGMKSKELWSERYQQSIQRDAGITKEDIIHSTGRSRSGSVYKASFESFSPTRQKQSLFYATRTLSQVDEEKPFEFLLKEYQKMKLLGKDSKDQQIKNFHKSIVRRETEKNLKSKKFHISQ